MKKQIETKFGLWLLFVLFIIAAYLIITAEKVPLFYPQDLFPDSLKGVEKFSSEKDFKNYLAQAAVLEYLGGFGTRGLAVETMRPELMEAPLMLKGAGITPERVSGTTVQVKGIDEPDIVKTDGKEIYYSREGERYYIEEMPMERMPKNFEKIPQKTGKTKIIKAFPPENLLVEAKIDPSGDLLLFKNVLIIFSEDKIYGYDVSSPQSPAKKWELKLEENNYIVGARLYNEKIYLIAKTIINDERPCPIKPLSQEGVPLIIECQEIYHPSVLVPVDVTYTGLILNPDSGEIEKRISFIGSSNLSIVYMSGNALYITYSYSGDSINLLYNFLKEEAQDLIPASVIQKIEKIKEYEISPQTKLSEIYLILEKYQNSLTKDEKMRVENELNNRMSDYFKKHKRDLEKTGIIKINLDEFKISANGDVPGRPLNQFSLDEYKNYLRVATTIGGRFSGWGVQESANDVYVLDENLKIIGSVYDLGLEEKIYSVRFLEDKGYLVTFRETDPFYVLDLSEPQKPELKGELKIPGYSSYLHPITKDKILGIGKEGAGVKVSFFDVSSPEKPFELDKYILKEYWSDVLNTHHAFLLDDKHEIFFLPGSSGGYIFSYKNDKLKLIKAVSEIHAKRAIYINDFLYIIAENKIVVLNEINWEKVKELEF